MSERLKDLTPREAAVGLAWAIAGEGCVGIWKLKSKDRGGCGYSFGPLVHISNSDPEFLRQIQEVYGGYFGETTNRRYGFRPCYSLQFRSREAVERVLKTAMPFLPAQRERCALVLKYCESRDERLAESHMASYSDDEIAIYKAVKLLAKKGPGPKAVTP